MKVSAWLRRLEPDHLYDHLIVRELGGSGITYDAETGLLTKGYGSTGVGVQLQRTTPAEIIAEMGQGVSLGDLGITEYLVSGQSIAHDLALLFIGRTPGNAYVTLGARQRADIDALEGAGL